MHAKQYRKKKRALRVRKSLRGTAIIPRMCVVKSSKHIYVQLIDDQNGITLSSSSTLSKEFKNDSFKKNKDSAKKLGETIADFALKNNIQKVLFDRGPFKYHGILAALADAARHKGLQF